MRRNRAAPLRERAAGYPLCPARHYHQLTSSCITRELVHQKQNSAKEKERTTNPFKESLVGGFRQSVMLLSAPSCCVDEQGGNPCRLLQRCLGVRAFQQALEPRSRICSRLRERASVCFFLTGGTLAGRLPLKFPMLSRFVPPESAFTQLNARELYFSLFIPRRSCFESIEELSI